MGFYDGGLMKKMLPRHASVMELGLGLQDRKLELGQLQESGITEL